MIMSVLNNLVNSLNSVYLEEFLIPLNNYLGLNNLTTTQTLLITAFLFMALILTIELKGWKVKNMDYLSGKRLLIVSIILIVLFGLGTALSLTILRENILLVIYDILFIALISFIKLDSTRDKALFHALSIAFIVTLAGRMIYYGTDSQETTADTLQIFINGYFTHSMHASWYDLAPVDAILKVMMLRTFNINNPYDPYTESLIFIALGILAYITIYVALNNNEKIRPYTTLAPAILIMNPYSVGGSLSVPPGIIALTFSVVILTYVLVINYLRLYLRMLLVLMIMFITATLAHPYSLLVLIILLTQLIGLRIKIGNVSNNHHNYYNYVLIALALSSVIWIAKSIYTAAINGVVPYTVQLLNAVEMALFGEQHQTILMGHILSVYGGTPSISLLGYSASIGVLSAFWILSLMKVIKDKSSRAAQLMLGLTVILPITAAAYLSTLVIRGFSRVPGTLSLSVMPAFVVLYLYLRRNHNASKYLSIIICLTALLTLITPGIHPANFNIGQSVRYSTINDVIYWNTVFTYIPSNYFKTYQASTNVLCTYQTAPIIMGSNGGIIADDLVQYVVIPGIVHAQSYWDFAGKPPILSFTPNELTTKHLNLVFSGWIYWVAYGKCG
jgi:hypothetical protein